MKDGDSLGDLSDKKFGLVGHSLSYSYGLYINSLIGNYEYKLYDIEPNNLQAFLKTTEHKALSIASPYKKIAYDLSTAVSGSAIKSHYVNFITKDEDGTIKGYNTDYDAFKALLKKHSVDVKGKKILILGTGGTANAARVALNEDGAAKVVLVSRHGPNNYDNLSVHYDSDIVINATPVGMYPNNGISPVDLEGFKTITHVIDFVYNPIRTAFMQQAMERNIRAISGLYILAASSVYQAQIFLDEQFDSSLIDTIKKKLLVDKRNITLIGMPGSGKSNIGRTLAQTLERSYIDIDHEIEKAEMMSVSDIFSTRGEAYFREAERNVTLKFCKESGYIISTGGGAVLSKENRNAIKENSFVVYIERNISDLYTDGRPVSTSIENLQRISEIRTPIYEGLADTIIRAHSSVDANVSMVLEALKNENVNY
ncbi:MAG: Shikimate kinase [Firmicutes bacterium ADurb.Bin300]|nr:MAG: Shikimate kinase [Firmicutes bacterium ADurb.Bin300]